MEVINGDCMELFDSSVVYDTMISDPPYSAYVHKNAVSSSISKGVRPREFGFASLTEELREFVAHVVATSVKRWSLIYSDVEGLHNWKLACENAGAKYIRPLPWIRWSQPAMSGDRPPSGCEFVSLFWGTQKGRKSWNGPGNLTHLDHKCLRGENKHKAEKPLDQALDLVQWFSNPGDHVLDLCAGSGTVGLACKILHREYTGYELDDTWATFANERIHNTRLTPRDQERFNRWNSRQHSTVV